jgi:hypothetical protein
MRDHLAILLAAVCGLAFGVIVTLGGSAALSPGYGDIADQNRYLSGENTKLIEAEKKAKADLEEISRQFAAVQKEYREQSVLLAQKERRERPTPTAAVEKAQAEKSVPTTAPKQAASAETDKDQSAPPSQHAADVAWIHKKIAEQNTDLSCIIRGKAITRAEQAAYTAEHGKKARWVPALRQAPGKQPYYAFWDGHQHSDYENKCQGRLNTLRDQLKFLERDPEITLAADPAPKPPEAQQSTARGKTAHKR